MRDMISGAFFPMYNPHLSMLSAARGLHKLRFLRAGDTECLPKTGFSSGPVV